MCGKGRDAYRGCAASPLDSRACQKDIPEELARASSQYPSVSVTYGKPIGVDQEVVKAVFTRIEETGTPYEHARVVVIGRGALIRMSNGMSMTFASG